MPRAAASLSRRRRVSVASRDGRRNAESGLVPMSGPSLDPARVGVYTPGILNGTAQRSIAPRCRQDSFLTVSVAVLSNSRRTVATDWGRR